jgi:hypothetical protein
VVIAFIKKNLGESSNLSLKELSQKLAMLLALTTTSRSSDLHLLDIQFRRYVEEGVTLQLAGLSKTRRSGPPSSIFLKRLTSN